MRFAKIIKNNVIKGIGMVLSPYPNYEQMNLNKHKRHNQINRWISEPSIKKIDYNNNELRYSYYKPSPTALLALRNDWFQIGNTIRKAVQVESNKL